MSKEIYLKSVTAEVLSKIEVLDWLEGFGDVLSLAERDYIRKYGFLLLKREMEIKRLKTNAENTIRKIEGDNAPDKIVDPVYSLSVLAIALKDKVDLQG